MGSDWNLRRRIEDLDANPKFAVLYRRRFLYKVEKTVLHQELPFHSNVVQLMSDGIDFNSAEQVMKPRLKQLGEYFIQHSWDEQHHSPKFSTYSIELISSKFLGVPHSMLEIICALKFEQGQGGLVYGYNYVKGDDGELFFWSNVLEPELAYEEFRQVLRD